MLFFLYSYIDNGDKRYYSNTMECLRITQRLGVHCLDTKHYIEITFFELEEGEGESITGIPILGKY